MQYSESQEMYLETILLLENQRGYARRIKRVVSDRKYMNEAVAFG